MKTLLDKIYILFLAAFTILFLWILFGFRIDINSREHLEGFTTISDYDVVTIEDSTAPKGILQTFTFTHNPENSTFGHLIFYSIHQEIVVYLDGTQIYSMNANKRNSFGDTPGRVWNIIQLNESDIGKEIRIDLIPVYDSAVDSRPIIYYGNQYDIITTIITRDFPALFISAISILAGIFYIAFTLYAYKYGSADNTLIVLGAFAILIGIWKMSDMDIFPLILNNNLASAYLPYFALLLACIPCTLFIRGLHSTKKHWIWYIPCLISYTSMFIEIILQILHIADFRETLVLTHLSILSMMLLVIAMMVYEIRKCGFTKHFKMNFICLCGCMVALLIDLIIYYALKAQATLLCGILAFIIYVFILGFSSIRELRKLIVIGQEARRYEQMAYHDKLTGLFNRTAYAEFISGEDFSPEHMLVAMFDLNNLKKCNDVYGHDQGDIYITTCARLISDCFSDIGNCYRLGGDEFCVLMKDVSLETCRSRLTTLNERVNKENAKKLIAITMQVAHGYVLYDKRIDYDILDTVRRADKMMYKEKYSMKQGTKVSAQ
ncbi:MAG: GGDEF domain-containing protein [Lachnospiraceae bacterium]|nr:GGDEF domain-containing protein [Lachnospiraceae bacterium]